MTETQIPDDSSPSVSMLRLTAEHLKKIKFPQLVRPALGPDAPPTIELIQWAIQAYSFPWIRHINALINGIVLLIDSDNIYPAGLCISTGMQKVFIFLNQT